MLEPRLHWIWEGFCALSRTRVNNQSGPQPIQPSEFAAYTRHIAFILDPEHVEDLFWFVMELDVLWLKKTYAKIEAELEKAKRKQQQRQRK